MVRGYAYVALAGSLFVCSSPTLAQRKAADRDAINFIGPPRCIDPVATRARLALLSIPNNYTITIDQQSPTDTVLWIYSDARSEAVLRRHYQFSTGDCAHAPDVLVIAVQRHFQSIEFVKAGQRRAQFVKFHQPESWADLLRKFRWPFYGQWLPQATLYSAWAPTGGEVDLGIGYGYGGDRNRIEFSGYGRLAWPRPIDRGQVYQATVLAGVRWRHQVQRWAPTVEVRAGAMALVGTGYVVNHTGFAPWVEAVVGLDRAVGPVVIGVKVGIAALQHRMLTTPSDLADKTSLVRVGINFLVPL